MSETRGELLDVGYLLFVGVGILTYIIMPLHLNYLRMSSTNNIVLDIWNKPEKAKKWRAKLVQISDGQRT